MNYLYFIKYQQYQEDICLYEMECLFGFRPDKQFFYSCTYIDPSRSVFIKFAIEVEYRDSSVKLIEEKITSDELHLNDYKIVYREISDVAFDKTMDARKKLGWAIEGECSMSNPVDLYCLTYVESEWILGRFFENDFSYKERRNKPHNYSFALDVWLAKTLTNIAVGNDLSKTVIDPCCGVGTVLIEGMVNGLNIEGSDINWKIVKASNYNLKHFGFKGDTTKRNINEINKSYDVAIVDLPYGKFIKEHKELANNIITEAQKIANKIVYVSMEPLDLPNIVKEITIQKRFGFSRYVTIIEDKKN